MTVVNGKPVRHPMVPDQTGAQARAEQGRVSALPDCEGGPEDHSYLSRTPSSTIWSRSGNKGKGVQDGFEEARANSSTVVI
ncbi:hypothetical protein PCANC_23149 [Puccinia coronata f. sp. avenae]|uniref:Uncharacterized protein n=1 Tax=Puccinia coronata f. sp. avenae TaxID=200324 RepID=A0A2N5SBK0_9BASI|nr:hypothetical protein PCANC_23149 [Puccinia coronata f. sp. avenae]PLW38290.1 hypothetical protein PCASD_08980 [Puccinia coronata f. sp. avenae]